MTENSILIDRILDLPNYDVVLSTRIGANINPLTAEKLAQLAIDSARYIKNGRDGISYLIAAKRNGIGTPLSGPYELEILRQLGVKTLEEALQQLAIS